MFPYYFEVLLGLCLVFLLYVKRPEGNSSYTFGIYRKKTEKYFYLKYFTSLLILKVKNLCGKSSRSVDILQRYEGCSRQIGYHIYASSGNKQALILENGNKLLLKIPEFADCFLVNEVSRTKDIGPIIVDHVLANSNIEKEKAVLSYNGLMKTCERDSKYFLVNIRAEWSVVLPYFNMYWEMSDKNFADRISREVWSKKYFENLNVFRHIDFWGGNGEMKGNVSIDGQHFNLFLNFTQLFSNGDLSLSRLVQRYVLHYITLPSGPRFCVGVANLPDQFSLLPVGWVSKRCKNYPLESCDFPLERFGVGKSQPPKAYHFLIDTDGGDMYNIIVRVKSAFRFYHTSDQFKKVIDPDCTFIVNGEEGWGHVQWYYRK